MLLKKRHIYYLRKDSTSAERMYDENSIPLWQQKLMRDRNSNKVVKNKK